MFGARNTGIPSGEMLNQLLALPAKQATAARVPIRMEFKTSFNTAYEDLRKDLRSLLSKAGAADVPFATTLRLSFAVRLMWVAAIVWILHTASGALATNSRLALLAVGLLQFVVAPMSAVVCLMRFGTNAPDCALHYLCSALAAALVSAASPALPRGLVASLRVTLDERFAAAFFLVDLALSFLVYFQTSERFGAARLLKHIVYGTFNTKTYRLKGFQVRARRLVNFGIGALGVGVTGTSSSCSACSKASKSTWPPCCSRGC